MRTATKELAWLLNRGYKIASALALVGNRHALRTRQRLAIQRAACTDAERDARAARRLADASGLDGRVALLDGFNCIIALEAALSGGVLIVGRDHVHRDLASVHGSYRRVDETERAVELIAKTLAAAGCKRARWWLDRPVSNSGRLAALIRDVAGAALPVDVELVNNPDDTLVAERHAGVVCSGDSLILDRCADWIDLPALVLATHAIDYWRVELS